MSRVLLVAAATLAIATALWFGVEALFPSPLDPTPADRVEIVDPDGRHGTVLRQDVEAVRAAGGRPISRQEAEDAFPSGPMRARPVLVIIVALLGLAAAFRSRRSEPNRK